MFGFPDVRLLLKSLFNSPFGLGEGYEKSRITSVRGYMFGIAIATNAATVFCLVAAGTGHPSLLFFRANNAITCFLTVAYVLASSRTLECIRRNHDAAVLLVLFHFISYQSLTLGRANTILSWLSTYDSESADMQSGDEAYSMLFNTFVLGICGYFHLLSLRAFFVLAVFAPITWILQVVFLGSHETFNYLLRLGFIYVSLCFLSFLRVRVTLHQLEAEFLRHLSEWSEVLSILQQASVPIALVRSAGVGPPASRRASHRVNTAELRGTSSGDASRTARTEAVAGHAANDYGLVSLSSLADDSVTVGEEIETSILQIELWNDALTELCQGRNETGTLVEKLPCFRPEDQAALMHAVRQALSVRREHTRRLLLPLYAAAAVTFLQLDVFPLSMGSLKAIIIGSDVTEFVQQHQSLLHRVDGFSPLLESLPEISENSGDFVERRPSRSASGVAQSVDQFGAVLLARFSEAAARFSEDAEMEGVFGSSQLSMTPP